MLVSRISPAPSACILRPHSSASSPVARRPPCVNTSQRSGAGSRHALRVDRDDDALRAVAAGGVGDELRILHRRGIDADLVRARVEQPPHVLDAAHAAAHGERNEDLRRDRFDDVEDETALVAARGDVEKSELVGALLVVAPRDLDRIAGVAQPDEIHAFDHAPGGDVEAGDDALGEGHRERSVSEGMREP